MANLIIGHTTETTARIWVRGNRTERRCDIVLEPDEGPPRRVRCEHCCDYTNSVLFQGLTAGTEYRVRATFAPEPAVVHGRFRTPKVTVRRTGVGFSFVLSSCNLSVISINNFLAFLLATAGTSVARTSLESEPDRWNAPRLLRVRRLWRFVLDKALLLLAWLVVRTTDVKQPGPPYVRSPFLKLAAVFDAWILDIEPARDAHFSVGDAVFTSAAKGLIAARFVPEQSNGEPRQGTNDSHDAKPVPSDRESARLIVLQLKGRFTKGALYKTPTSDRPQTAAGTITEVQRATPWYEQPSFFIHAGDQIYYDFPRGSREPDRDKYRLAYREAWFDDEPNRYLLSHWPQYMTLDDHEIADQFSLDFKPPGEAFPSAYLNEATIAYREYVDSLGPSTTPVATAPPRRTGPFWYTFDRVAFEASPVDKRYARFFVLDTRTERRAHGDRPQMIDEDQLRQLLDWMQRYKEDLKFVVTSVPFVAEVSEAGSRKTTRWPLTSAAPHAPGDDGTEEKPPNPLNDKWCAQAFRPQRDRIIEFIAEKEIEQLVFLTGDMHCCYYATMRVELLGKPAREHAPQSGGGPLEDFTAPADSKYKSIVVHELAGGPVNQLQLSDVREFNRFCRRRFPATAVAVDDEREINYEVTLERFHGEVNGVLHLRLDYQVRDQITGQGPERAYVPEVEWNVIRTLTETERTAWSEEQANAPEVTFSAGEPVMRGRISFTRKREPHELRPWS